MLHFLDLNKRSIYTLLLSLFLLSIANLVKLPILNYVKSPADIITFTANAQEKEHIKTTTHNLSDPAISHQSSRPLATTTPTAQLANASNNTAPVAPNAISFAGHNIPIFYTNDYMVDSGNSVGFYGNYLLYGHNSANVFGSLTSLAPGTTITLTINGQSTQHQVLRTSLLTKDQTASYMRAVINGRHIGGDYEHNYVLMTCAGTLVGNGDATHRYLVFIK